MTKTVESTEAPKSKGKWWITISAILALSTVGMGLAAGTFPGLARDSAQTPSSGAPTNPVIPPATTTPAATATTTPAAPNPTSSSATSRVEIVPTSVELQPKNPASALLIMRNPSASILSKIKVTPVTDAELSVNGRPSFDDEQSLVSKGELAWAVEITNKSADPATGSVIFRVQYFLGQADAQAVPQVTYAVLQVRSRDVAELAEVTIETTLESLDQQHPGRVYLVIKNKSNQSIAVKDEVAWDLPGFIRITATKKGQTFDFPPHQTGMIPFDVSAASQVQSGKHLLVATVPFEWGGAARTQKRTLVVTKSIQVGVLGESALLKLFAIPSFLIIPGFIGVVIWGLLWKWGLFKTRGDSGEFPLQFSEQPTKPEFWVAAITISIPMILGYMLLINRDVLGLYGLFDLVKIWLASVFFLGLLGYALIIGGRRWYLSRRTPSEKDKAIDILRKLDRQRLEVFLDRVEFNRTEGATTKTYRALLLQKRDNNRSSSWVGPAIQVIWKAGASKEVKEAVDNERKVGGNPGKIVEAIQKAGNNVDLKWKEPATGSLDIKEPTEVNTADLKFAGLDSVVEV